MRPLRASYAMKKGIMETLVGGLFNKFMRSMIRRRRNTLFFEDIVSEYVKECEMNGHRGEMYELGREWFATIFQRLFSPTVLKFPPNILVNVFLAKAWKLLGTVEDVHLSQRGDEVIVRSLGESITRRIGKNEFTKGLVAGMAHVIYRREIRWKEAVQSKRACRYIFLLTNRSARLPEAKQRWEYDRMNRMKPIPGFSLDDALSKGVFTMSGTRIFFRGKPVWFVENTLFHLIGRKGTLMKEVPTISQKFFESILKEKRMEKGLILLKTLLQIMGWGRVRILMGDRSLSMVIRNPPHGFQIGTDDYGFLALSILGYVRTLDEGYMLSSTKLRDERLTISLKKGK